MGHLTNITMKVVFALLVVLAVAAQAVDVHFCHLNVDMSTTAVKGQIGTTMSASISYPGCATVSNVDMTATQFMLLDASDDSTLATQSLTTLQAAAKGANYVLVTPSATTGNSTFVQPRSSTDIPAGDVQLIAVHAAKMVGNVDVTVNGVKVPSNFAYGSNMYLNVASADVTGDVVALNPATNATLITKALPAGGIAALVTAVVAAVGEMNAASPKDPQWFFNVAGGASGTTTGSAAAFTSPAAAVVAVVAAVVSVVAMAL